MFCRNCGAENDSSSVYCENCGQKLNEEPLVSNINNKNTNNNILKIIMIFVILAGIVALVIHFQKNGKKEKIKYLQEQLSQSSANNDYDETIKLSDELYDLTQDVYYKNISDMTEFEKVKNEKIAEFDRFVDKESFYDAYKIIMEFRNDWGAKEEDLQGLISTFEGALNYRLDENSTYNDYGNSVKILEELLELEPDNEFFRGLLSDAKNNSKLWKR